MGAKILVKKHDQLINKFVSYALGNIAPRDARVYKRIRFKPPSGLAPRTISLLLCDYSNRRVWIVEAKTRFNANQVESVKKRLLADEELLERGTFTHGGPKRLRDIQVSPPPTDIEHIKKFKREKIAVFEKGPSKRPSRDPTKDVDYLINTLRKHGIRILIQYRSKFKEM